MANTKYRQNPQKQNIDVLFADAMKLQRQGDLSSAYEKFAEILSHDPHHGDALALSGIIQCQNGKLDEGIRFLEQAVAVSPQQFDARLNLTMAYESVERLEEATDSCRRLIELKPDFLDAYRQLASLLDRQGKTEAAEQSMREALLTSPKDAELFYALIQRQVKNNHLAGALETCERFFQSYPNNMRALAFMPFVLNEQGDETAARNLLDFDRFVHCFTADQVPGYESPDALNTDLIDFILSHPSLAFEPDSKSTRFGSQTASLQSETAKPMDALRRMIEKNVGNYRSDLTGQADHPYLAAIPSSLSLDIWATALPPSGHQKPHFHPGGWVSGVYYPALPESMLNDTTTTSGHIEFGRPQEQYGFNAHPLLRTIRPEVGLMILFPSYFYHRTIPVVEVSKETAAQRFSIAFDAIPLS
jgi:tetratricopeptide (TPR) repeat protein